MRNKIATITFHWAPNYGAVLQAYALQQHLLNSGYDTEIINYVPTRMKIVMAILSLKRRDTKVFAKERRIKRFRKQEIIVSKKYSSSKKLKMCASKYKAIISGSDQIWNQSFTLKAEGKPTLSYFLNFSDNETKRIAYAVSFGSVSVTEAYKKLVAPEIEKFEAIAVREASGISIVEEFAKEAKLVCDPTLLLTKDFYYALANKAKTKKMPSVFPYIINTSKQLPQNIAKYISKNDKLDFNFNDGIYEWLSAIKNSKFIVTNSFHGVVFSVIFQKPFIATLIEGSGMNDRITTLLEKLSLGDRVLLEYNEESIDNLLNATIDWDSVQVGLESLRKEGESFLKENLMF